MNEGKREYRGNALNKTDKKDDTTKGKARRVFGRFKGYLITGLLGVTLVSCTPALLHKGKNSVGREEVQKTAYEDLIEAVKEGDTKKVKDFLEKGADVNAKDNYGSTLLMIACREGWTDIAELLLEKGADVNAKNKHNDPLTALTYAARGGYEYIVELLVSKGVDQEAKNFALGAAAWCGHTDVVEVLIDAGAEVNAYGGYGALCGACHGGYTDVVEVLIDAGAEVNVKDTAGNTALMVAAWEGQIDVVELLLMRGADVNERNNDGWTALKWAKIFHHEDVIELLKQHGGTE